MKNTYWMIAFGMFASISIASAQHKNSYSSRGLKNVIKVDPVSPLQKSIYLAYEYTLEEDKSIQLLGGISRFDMTLWEELSGSFEGFKLIPEFRYYPFERSYLAFWIKHQQYKGKLSGVEPGAEKTDFFHSRTNAVGVNLGFQSGIKGIEFPNVDFYVGAGFQQTKVTAQIFEDDTQSILNTSGITWRIGVLLGIPHKLPNFFQ